MDYFTMPGFIWTLGTSLFLILLFSFLFDLMKAMVAPGKKGSRVFVLIVYLFFILPAKVFISAGPFRFALIPVYILIATGFVYASLILVINILRIG